MTEDCTSVRMDSPTLTNEDEKEHTNVKEPCLARPQPFDASDLALSQEMSCQPSDTAPDRAPPSRPVYKDLTTAHSFITSGPGRSRSPSSTNDAVNDPIEMHNMQIAPAPAEVTTNTKVLPALPLLVSREKYNLHSGVFFEKPKGNLILDKSDGTRNEAYPPMDTRKELQMADIPDPLFTPPKIPLSTKPTITKIWPRNSLELDRKHGRTSKEHDILTQNLVGDTSEGNDEISTEGHSLPGSSTIDRIVETYVHSNGVAGPQSFMNANTELLNAPIPASSIRHHAARDAVGSTAVIPCRGRGYANKSPGNPPAIALPVTPEPVTAPLATSSSVKLGPSTSYGDTRNLLELTQKSHHPLKPSGLSREAFRQNIAGGEPEECTTAAVAASSPYETVSVEDSNHFEYDDGHFGGRQGGRLPLERDVSKALRRESALSDESDGTITSSILNPPNNFHSKPADSRGTPGLRAPLTREKILLPRQLKDSSFYAEGALAQEWVDAAEHNIIRVPVTGSQLNSSFQPGSLTHGDLQPYVEDFNEHDEGEDDAGDWETDRDTRGYPETVAGSGFGLDMRGYPDGMLGGTVRQTGESIADMSDRDAASLRTISTFPRLNGSSHYGSTERIAHHPAPVAYAGNYRQAEVKKTNVPVMMPSYQQHKVNGYFADSTRLRPRNLFSHVHKRLDKAHANPFQEVPPEVLAKSRLVANEPTQNLGYKKSVFSRNKAKGKNRLRLSSFSQNNSEEVGIPLEPISSFKPISNPKFEDKSEDWIADQYGEPYGSPGPALRSGGRIQNLSKHKDFVDIDLRDRNSYQYVIDQAMGNSTSSSGAGGPLIDGSVRTPVFGGRPGRDSPNHCTPFTKDPRGTPYNRANSPTANRGSRQIDILDALQFSPPRQIRGDTRPQTQFSYRSPLAPPQDKIWNSLYTGSQVIQMEQAVEPVVRTLYEQPRVIPRNNGPISNSLATRKIIISSLVLVLCNLFPPLLICFKAGKLDSIMVWLTNGEVTGFGKTSKLISLCSLCAWVGALISTLAFILYLKLHNG